VITDSHVLEQLPLLDAVLQENLRLKTAAPVISMQVVADTVLGETWLPAAAPVFLLLRHAGKHSSYYPQGEQFQPQRWLANAPEMPDLARKLLTFGGGPRLCPGRFLALVEMKMLTSMIVQNFELTPLPGPPAQEMFSFTMVPSKQAMRLRLRTSAPA